MPCLLVNNFVPIIFFFRTFSFSCNYADYVNRSSVRTDDRMSDVNQMISRGKDRDQDYLSIYHCSITFELASEIHPSNRVGFYHLRNGTLDLGSYYCIGDWEVSGDLENRVVFEL